MSQSHTFLFIIVVLKTYHIFLTFWFVDLIQRLQLSHHRQSVKQWQQFQCYTQRSSYSKRLVVPKDFCVAAEYWYVGLYLVLFFFTIGWKSVGCKIVLHWIKDFKIITADLLHIQEEHLWFYLMPNLWISDHSHFVIVEIYKKLSLF